MASRSRWGRGSAGARWWLAAPVAALALLGAIPQVSSAFNSVTDGASTLTTAASFPTYPSSVTGDGPQLYHRMEDAPSAAASGTAADSSGNGRTGVYADATDGPALLWRLDEGAGATASDVSGGANPGTLTNGPAWGVGVARGGLTFDGVDDVVLADQAVATDLGFTVSAWARPTTPGAARTVLSQAGTAVAAVTLRYTAAGSWAVAMPRSDSAAATVDTATSAAPAELDRWTHLTAVYDDTADEIRLYVDGVLSDTAAHTTDFAAYGAFAAGRGWTAGAEHFAGSIDEVAAYPQALTATEVAAAYSKPRLRWGFDAVSFSVTDLSGNGNHGTAAGSPTFANGAINLSGSTYVTGPDCVRTDDSFTVAAWANLSNTTGNHAVASAVGTTGSAFVLRSSGTTWQFLATETDASAPATVTLTATTAATVGTWVHVAGVYDDTDNELRLYVNGVLEASASRSNDWHAGGFTVGRAKSAGSLTDYFAGSVDDVRLWDHALAATDLATLDVRLTSRFEFEDGAGSAITDLALNRTQATLTGSYAWNANGHSGSAVTFSGGYATAPAALDTTGSYTVAAWVRLSTIAPNNHTIVGQDATHVSGFFLQHDNWGGKNTWAMRVEGADSTSPMEYVASGTSTAVTGRWTHVVGVYDDAVDLVRVYVNGVQEDNAPAPADIPSTGSLTIGAAKYGGARTDQFPGDIDEVRTYNRALGGADIADLYRETASAYWRLDENAGTTLADSSGSNRPATATTTTPTWTTGYRGSALSFSGSGGQATAPAAVRTDQSFTVSAWVRLAGTGVTRTAVSQDGTSYSGFQLGYDAGLNKYVFRMRDGDAATPSSAAPSQAVATAGTWVHLAGVYDDPGDQIILYVNGARQTRVLGYGGPWHAAGSTVIGRALVAGAAGERWSGQVDEVRLWRRALDGSAMTDVMASTRPNIAPADLHLAGQSVGRVGALQGAQQGLRSSGAVAFNGTSHAYNNTGTAGPNTFSLECWFRVSGSAGGALLGFSSSKTAMTGDTADRVVYVDSGGRLTFGVAPGGVKTTIRSTAAYNDAGWHHVVASLGAGGMQLWVDGALVASNAGVTTAQAIATGYYRWGGTNLTGWANEPASDRLVGSVDEVAQYGVQLTANQVARHYAADH